MTIVKVLFRVATVVPMHTTIKTVLYFHTGSGVNQETWFASYYCLLWQNTLVVYIATTEVANELVLLCVIEITTVP